jgi:hypothetical protein
MVSIHLRGVFALNEQAFQALGVQEAVELFKDRDEWIFSGRPSRRTRRAPEGRGLGARSP